VDGWNRYYRQNTDLEPLLDAALPVRPGATIEGLQRLDQAGFFLEAARAARALPRGPEHVADLLAGTRADRRTRAVALRSLKSAVGVHTDVIQTLHGAPVVGSRVRVHQDGGRVYAVTGRPLAGLAERDPGRAPAVLARPATARRHALAAAAATFDRPADALEDARVRTVVFPTAAGATWAHEVRFVVRGDGADVYAYVGAAGGDLLLSYNIAQSATADVYDINPDRGPLQKGVALDPLAPPGTCIANADFRVVAHFDGRPAAPVGGAFRFGESDDEFDQPQVYHHLTRAAAWFRRVSGRPDPFKPLKVYVRDPAYAGNAVFLPTPSELRFGLYGRRSSARSLSIVTHELGHAVTDRLTKLGRARSDNTESRGLAEGYSDYFAAALLDDPRFGDYAAGDPAGLRTCAHAGAFPAGYRGEEHATGNVWAAVLWDLRERLGAGAADTLIYESAHFVSWGSRFENGVTGLKKAAARLGTAIEPGVIDEAFTSRRPG
jgi:hypothetical protein